jgi:N-acetylglucosamine malate deacetylase 1
MKQFKRALVLAPHTDDGEFGAGGLISKLVEDGTKVYYVAFSICEESVPDGYHAEVLSDEVMLATAELGISSENVFIHRFKVRLFTDSRQAILETMIDIKKRINPDLVIMPSKFDCHQDHQVIHNEGIRAFKDSTMLGYEILWNNISFEANLVVKLDEGHINAKVRAISKYKSQSFRTFSPDMIKKLSQVRGLQIKSEFAEAYNIIRWVWE